MFGRGNNTLRICLHIFPQTVILGEIAKLFVVERYTVMNIQLSSQLEAILKERLVYTSEFINAAIAFALENDEFKRKWLQKELQEGLDQADRGEFYDLAEVVAEIHNSRPSCQKSNSAVMHAQI